jgi:hypothetical protein
MEQKFHGISIPQWGDIKPDIEQIFGIPGIRSTLINPDLTIPGI